MDRTVPPPAPHYLTAPGHPWVVVTCDGTSYRSDDERTSGAPADPRRTEQDAVAFARSAVAALRDQPLPATIVLGDIYDAAHLIPAPNIRLRRRGDLHELLAGATVLLCPAGSDAISPALARGIPVAAVSFGDRDSDHAQRRLAARISDLGVGASCSAQRLSARRLRRTLRRAIACHDGAATHGPGLVPLG